jgi:hypothetical protein
MVQAGGEHLAAGDQRGHCQGVAFDNVVGIRRAEPLDSQRASHESVAAARGALEIGEVVAPLSGAVECAAAGD